MFDDDGDVIDDAFELVQVRSFRHDTDEGFWSRTDGRGCGFIAQFFFASRMAAMMRLLSSQPDFV